ncbi:MAG: septum formation protein Maf [Elusimicrobia bacterium]|nr:septum formation protein Maf [Elusimicrobiota bacterium]
MPILILASQSERRIDILKREKIKFKVFPSKIEEKTFYKKPSLMVKDLAVQKALAVSAIFPDNPVLAADTIVYLGGKVLGKPKNKKDAFKLLKFQNGKKQSVYTGVCIIWRKKKIKISDFEKSYCYARKLSQKELKALAGKHMDKAGAYAVQDTKDEFIKKIEGDFDNVVGLPMKLTRKLFKKAGLGG